MTLPQLPDPGTQLDVFSMTGGLDLVSPALSIPSGTLLACQNYEPDLNGGYQRSGEYERFDGRDRPSAATFYALAYTKTGTINPGDTVTIGAVTATYVKDLTGGGLLANPSGTPPASTAVQVSAVTQGTTEADPQLDYGFVLAEEAQALADTADQIRTAIGTVPGEGDVWGVFMLGSTVYALRNDASPATTAKLYKSSASGWTAVTLPYEISFDTGSAVISEGDTVTGAVSGATATVRRVVLETGSWAGGDAAGRLIIDTITGTFNSSENLQVSAATKAVSTSSQSQITLNGSGRLRAVRYSFGGRSDGARIYAADGVNRPWEFDGTYLVPIDPKISGMYPTRVAANRRYLFWTYGGSLIYSEVDEPYKYNASLGAGEIAVGDQITNLVVLPGEALGIFTRNTTQALTGASASEWTLQTIAADVGALADTVQTAMETYALDDRGIVSVSASDRYGNFGFATASRKVQPLIRQQRPLVVDSCVVRETGIYRLFCSDGYVISLLPGEQAQFGSLFLQFEPVCVWSGEDSTGAERVFAGAADGYVYELDVGQSQDGEDLTAFLRTHYVNQQSPRTRKRYRKLALDVKPERYMTIRISGELSYGDTGVGGIEASDVTSAGAGGIWDVSHWDEFFWDGRDIDQPEVRLLGTGINLSLTIYQSTNLDAGHVIQSAIVHYTPRRLKR